MQDLSLENILYNYIISTKDALIFCYMFTILFE